MKIHARKVARPAVAFTLIEVMIAMGIFFLAVFAILGVVSSNIRNARTLQKPRVDMSLIIGELSLTNKLTEGTVSGKFGDLYPDYEWTYDVKQVRTNGLFQVDLAVYRRHGDPPDEQHMTILLYRPDSSPGIGFQ